MHLPKLEIMTRQMGKKCNVAKKRRVSKDEGAKIRPGPVDIKPGVTLSTLAWEHMGPAQLVVIPGANPSADP